MEWKCRFKVENKWIAGSLVGFYGDKKTLCIDTGMSDRKNVRIFEHDVVGMVNTKYPKQRPEFYEVIWKPAAAGFVLGQNGDYYRTFDGTPDFCPLEVVGNTIDNPELLKTIETDEEFQKKFLESFQELFPKNQYIVISLMDGKLTRYCFDKYNDAICVFRELSEKCLEAGEKRVSAANIYCSEKDGRKYSVLMQAVNIQNQFADDYGLMIKNGFLYAYYV